MRHLFLTGASGIGKSTLLMEALQNCRWQTAGLFTQRLLSEDGSTSGFRLLPWTCEVTPTALYHPGLTDVFIRKTGGGWEKDLSVFASTGVRLLDHAAAGEIICLDELGGAELLVPEFRSRLYQLLDSHPCCTGVIKGSQNLHALIDTVAVSGGEEASLHQFHRDLNGRFHSSILCLTQANKELIAQTLCSFLSRR